MPNSAFSRGQRQGKIPISITGPFPLKIGDKKSLLYGFGRMASISPKISPTTPRLRSSLNFGKLSTITYGFKKFRKLGLGRPVSVSSIPGPRLGSVGVLGR